MSENTNDPNSGPVAAPEPSAVAAALERRIKEGRIVRGRRCLYVRDQLILSDLAAVLLEEELGGLQGQRDREQPFLDELGLQLWGVATEGSESLVVTAARLQSVALARVEDVTSDREVDALRRRLDKPGGATGERWLFDPVTVSGNLRTGKVSWSVAGGTVDVVEVEGVEQ